MTRGKDLTSSLKYWPELAWLQHWFRQSSLQHINTPGNVPLQRHGQTPSLCQHHNSMVPGVLGSLPWASRRDDHLCQGECTPVQFRTTEWSSVVWKKEHFLFYQMCLHQIYSNRNPIIQQVTHLLTLNSFIIWTKRCSISIWIFWWFLQKVYNNSNI